MLIKTGAGDRSIVFGHWANMKKGVPGSHIFTNMFNLAGRIL